MLDWWWPSWAGDYQLPVAMLTLVIANYLLIGVVISAYSYATTKREPGWPIAFAAMTLLWPLALVPWDRLGLD